MLDRETMAFIRRALAAGRVSDGARPLVKAGRLALFRLRRRGQRKRPQEDVSPVAAQQAPFVPIERVAAPVGFGDALQDRSRILAEAASQRSGAVRLAGGRLHELQNGVLGEVRDPEDRHAYHRLYWLLRFAKASYCGAGVDDFVQAWRRWSRDGAWRKQPEALAAYTTAERICSLEESLFWTAGAATGTARAEILDQIWNDAWHLHRNVEHGLGVHNHLLQNGRALLRAGRLFAAEGLAFREKGLELGERYWPSLLDAEGVLLEQSSHYHVLLSRAALDYLLLADQEPPMSSGLRSLLPRMFDLTNDLVRADGSLPRFGDSSPDAMADDLRGLGAAAWRFGAASLAPRDRALTALTLYYAAGERSAPKPETPGSRLYAASGFGFLRSADGRLEAAIHADPRPDAYGHGNCARGAFELSWNGAPLIREPGAFRDSTHVRYIRQRGPQGHNTCMIDGLAPALDADSRRRFPAWYENGRGSVRMDSGNALRYVWRGFQRARRDVEMERRWRISERAVFTFEERFEGSGRHAVESRLHLGDVACSELDRIDDGYRLICSGLAGGQAARLAISATPGLEVSMELGWRAPEYGVEDSTPVLVIRGLVRFPCRWGVEIELQETGAEDSLSLLHGEAAPVAVEAR